jgi:hypothetical protein
MKFLTPLLLIGISIGLFIWYINPTYQETGALRDEGQQYSLALGRAREAGVKRDELISRYNTFSSDDINRIQKILPDHVDNIKLAVDINSIAAKYGSGIRNVKIDESSSNPAGTVGIDQKAYGTLAMSFGVTMPYENFLRFLTDLEQSLRLSDVSSVTFDSTDLSAYQYNVNIKTYWLK